MLNNEIDVESLWSEICYDLKTKLPETRYSTWIEVLKPICYEDNQLMVLCHSNYVKVSINNIFKQYIEDSLDKILLGFTNEHSKLLAVTVNDDEYLDFIKKSDGGQASFFSKKEKKTSKKKSFTKINDNSLNFPEKYTFDNFIRGKNNEFAIAAAMAVAKTPAAAYNPLFIYGNSGLGKTHLMKAVGHDINKNFDCKVLYLSSEQFTNDLVQSIKNVNKNENAQSEFRNKYRNVDVLLIDDIQFIAGKERTQEEFFHTFNELYSRNKQIIISSDRPPKEIKNLEDRLKSRFNMGLTVDIQAPDFETRMAILQDKIKLESIILNDDILEFIAMNISTNIRELEGALINVLAHYKLKTDAPMTVDYVKSILSEKLNQID